MHTAIKTATSTLPGHFNAAYVWLISATAALGGLLFGYDWVVIGGAKPFYENYFRLSSEQQIGGAALFLEAQARFALGEPGRARELLDQVLRRDPSHARAADLLDEMRCEAHLDAVSEVSA